MPIIKAKQNNRLFIKYKRLADGFIADMPKRDWDRIQRDKIRVKQFEFIEEINLDSTIPQASAGQVENVPIIEDEFECPICGYVADDEEDLKLHKNKHI